MFSPSRVDLVLAPAEMPAPDSEKVTGLIDKEMGGVAIEDASQGLDTHLWLCEVVGSNVTLSVDGGPPFVLFARPGIVDVALAFTQSMQPTVAWRQADGTLWMRYYDGTVPGYVIAQFGTGLSPRLTLDDKRQGSLAMSDIIFAYVSDGQLRYRLQRERFETEHVLLSGLAESSRIERIGMVNLRMQFVLNVPSVGA